uniref:PIR2-like helical domain-containing protein n=1 Tax=Aegilops tauschii subsp. strangulata TaxID=200361 RepID=A0A453Q2N7_AEGTS
LPSMEAAAPFAALRVYGPSNFRDEELVFNSGEIGRLQSELLAKIQSCYGRARQLPGVFDAGFCFGLLDPVSNIVAGASIARAAVDAKEEAEEERSLPGARLGEPDLIGDMNRRSFHGLVAFLTALFPHLTNAMAIWYLNEARLDPLVAAHLIIKRRGMERSFGFASDTTAAAVETALRCAAASAQHPNPSQFALGWKLLSHSDLNNVAAVLPSSANSDHSDESFATAIAMVDNALLKEPSLSAHLSFQPGEIMGARLCSPP